MSQWDVVALVALGSCRFIDTDSAIYRDALARVATFDDRDLCFLAAKNLPFVSAMADREIKSRVIDISTI